MIVAVPFPLATSSPVVGLTLTIDALLLSYDKLPVALISVAFIFDSSSTFKFRVSLWLNVISVGSGRTVILIVTFCHVNLSE